MRRESLLASGVTFSLLFGGGARYGSGEDSLFLKTFIDKGFSVYTAPVTIAEEKAGESTWFAGYNEKFSGTEECCTGICMAGLPGLWRCAFCLPTGRRCARKCR